MKLAALEWNLEIPFLKDSGFIYCPTIASVNENVVADVAAVIDTAGFKPTFTVPKALSKALSRFVKSIVLPPPTPNLILEVS